MADGAEIAKMEEDDTTTLDKYVTNTNKYVHIQNNFLFRYIHFIKQHFTVSEIRKPLLLQKLKSKKILSPLLQQVLLESVAGPSSRKQS